MRVTESRMMELAAERASQARDRVADASGPAAGGLRVTVPSDDVTGWEEGERASLRTTESQARGTAIERVRDRVAATDGALSNINTALNRVQQLAVQMSNDTLSAPERAAAGVEVASLRETILAQANAVGNSGESLLGGSQTGASPFTVAGLFVGDTKTATVETSEGATTNVGVNGTVLTASNGVDILSMLDTISTALSTNDVTTLRATLPDVTTAISQVANARALTGGQMNALDDADDARKQLEVRLAATHQRAVEADPIAAASTLAEAKNALDAATQVAAVVNQIASGKS